MVKEIAFIPIHRGFNYASNPIGYVDLSGEEIVLKFNDKADISAEDVNSGLSLFAPSYLITKEKDGTVKEIRVESFSLVNASGGL